MNNSFSLIIGLFFLIFLTGCLDIPSEPDESLKVQSIGIWLIKNNDKDSLYYKTNASEPFSLKAYVTPKLYTEDLQFYWYRDQVLLGDSLVFKIDTPFVRKDIPNQLIAMDSENNSLVFDFIVYLNHLPEINSNTIPSNQDTLYGSLATAILFSWSSQDLDSEDTLNHYIKIDSTTYFTGKLTSFQQSGFEPGAHSFSIWVVDSFGDADTLETKTFVMIDSTGALK